MNTIITIENYLEFQPNAQNKYADSEIQSAINLSYTLLDAECGGAITDRWMLVSSDPLYLTDKQREHIRKAFLIETQYVLMNGLDFSKGSDNLSIGGFSMSSNRPNRNLISPQALKELQLAEIWYQTDFITAKNGRPGHYHYMDELMKPLWIDKPLPESISNKRYVWQFTKNPNQYNKILKYDSQGIIFYATPTEAIGTYLSGFNQPSKKNKITFYDGDGKEYKDIRLDIVYNELMVQGNNLKNSALTPTELIWSEGLGGHHLYFPRRSGTIQLQEPDIILDAEYIGTEPNIGVYITSPNPFAKIKEFYNAYGNVPIVALHLKNQFDNLYNTIYLESYNLLPNPESFTTIHMKFVRNIWSYGQLSIHEIFSSCSEIGISAQLYRKENIGGTGDVYFSAIKGSYSDNTSLNNKFNQVQRDIDSKSTVSVSETGTSTDEVNYITVNGVEKKLAGGLKSVGFADLTGQYSDNQSLNTKITSMDNEIGSKQNQLSQPQLDAVNSGINSERVSQYDGYALRLQDKQNIHDEGLNTLAKDIVPAINEVLAKAEQKGAIVISVAQNPAFNSEDDNITATQIITPEGETILPTDIPLGTSVLVVEVNTPDRWLSGVVEGVGTFTRLTEKIDLSNYYNKGEVDDLLSNKANIVEVNELRGRISVNEGKISDLETLTTQHTNSIQQIELNKADLNYVNEQLANKADKTYVDETFATKQELSGKADQVALENEVQARTTAISEEAEARTTADTNLQTQLNDKANRNDLAQEVSDRQDADTQLQEKIDTKSTVSVSATGTSTEEIEYITVNGVEKKIKSGGGEQALIINTTLSTTERDYIIPTLTQQNIIDLYNAHSSGKNAIISLTTQEAPYLIWNYPIIISSKPTYTTPTSYYLRIMITDKNGYNPIVCEYRLLNTTITTKLLYQDSYIHTITFDCGTGKSCVMTMITNEPTQISLNDFKTYVDTYQLKTFAFGYYVDTSTEDGAVPIMSVIGGETWYVYGAGNKLLTFDENIINNFNDSVRTFPPLR